MLVWTAVASAAPRGGDSEVAAGTPRPPVTAPSGPSLHLVGAEAYDLSGTLADNEVILAVYLRRRHELSDGIVAYATEGDLLLPLEELALLLEFAIRETPTGAAGWFLSEDNRFTLDLERGEVVSRGRAAALNPQAAVRLNGVLYVSAAGLARWLDMGLHVDLTRQRLHVNPVAQIAIEQRRQRDSKRYGAVTQFRSRLPRQATPYRWLQVPGTEVDITTGYADRTRSGVYAGGTVRAYGDVLLMNGEVFVTATDRGVRDARIRLGRRDPDGGLLGGLDATSWSVGDVAAPPVPLVSSSLSGRGARVTSRARAYLAEFDRVTLEDSLPVNWEVELYRNNILLASFGPSQEGSYRFDDVPLLRGSNEIQLEFYGPRGERRTEARQYYVGGGQVPVGQFNYDVSLHEVGRSVFGFTNWVRDRDDYDNQAFGGAARFDYGIGRNLSVTAGVVATPLPTDARAAYDSDYRVYGIGGMRTRLGDFAVSLDGAVDDTGGVAAGVAAQTAYGDWNVALRHEHYLNDFVSSASLGVLRSRETAVYRTSYSLVRADTFFADLYPGIYLNLGLLGSYTTFAQRDAEWSFGSTFGVSAGWVSLSSDLLYGSDAYAGDVGVFGGSRLNMRFDGGVRLRASVDYDLRADTELTAYSFAVDAPLAYDVFFSLGYARRRDGDIDDHDSETFFTSLRRDFGFADVGLIAAYDRHDTDTRDDDDDGFRVGLTVAFSTLTDPETLATQVSGKRIGRRAALVADAFFDHNHNGVRDAGEDSVPDARVLYAGQREPLYTGRGPSAPIGARGGWLDVALDKGSLDDPSLSPAGAGVAVLPRPGTVTRVALPVVATAGLEGHVRLRNGRDVVDLANMTVQVVSRDDEGGEAVVAEAKTEFDGLFAFADLATGTYLVRVDPAQARQIGLKPSAGKTVELTRDTGVLEGVELTLARARLQPDKERRP